MISAVIFDMDGLLIDSEPFWRRAQKYSFATVGLDLNEDDMRHTMGRRIDEVVEHWWHEKPWQGATRQDIEALIVDKVIELVNTEGVAMPGVMSTLELLKEKKLPMAIASSSSVEIIDAVVTTLNIKNYFDYIYSAQHETHGKPHPGVFISTAHELNIPPHRCLVFEDSPSGVLAAKAAKMVCIAVPAPENINNKVINIADKLLGSLDEFSLELLESF